MGPLYPLGNNLYLYYMPFSLRDLLEDKGRSDTSCRMPTDPCH